MSFEHAIMICFGYYCLCLWLGSGGLNVIGWAVGLLGPILAFLGIFGPSLGIGY